MSTVVMLSRDLKAKAGQFLVVRADGGVFAVDPDMLPLVLCAAVPTHNSEPVAEFLSRKEAVSKAREMIIAGSKTREIAKVTGLANATIYRHRNALASKGLVARKRGKNAGEHHFYKTPEALERARQRGESMKKARLDKETV
jgi:hypothetical protein